MSLTFACPGCNAQVQIAEEHAGQTGQCPRCLHVLIIPAPGQPLPIAVEATSTPKAITEPQAMPPSSETPTAVQDEGGRPTSAGSWSFWLMTSVGVLCVGVLALNSFLVLTFWQRDEPARAVQVVDVVRGENNPPVQREVVLPPALENGEPLPLVGRLRGERVFFDNGAFQIRTELTAKDPLLPDKAPSQCHCKQYTVKLRSEKAYVLQQTSAQFDCSIRVAELNNELVSVHAHPGSGNVRLVFRPPQTGTYVVYATSNAPAFGAFTLTIREREAGKPKAP